MISFFIVFSVPTYAAFNDIGVGARPLGLGGAFVAAADDGNAMRYNAGGLGYIDDIQLSLTYARHFSGLINYNYAGIVIPLGGAGSFGASFGLLSEDAKIYKEQTITFAYSRRLLHQISTGINLKLFGTSFDESNEWIQENPYFTQTSTSAFTVDLGLLAKPVDGLNLGIAAENLIPANVNISDDVPDDDKNIPVNIRLGLAYNLSAIAQSAQQEALRDILAKTQIMSEFSIRNGESEIHLGAEAWVHKTISIRGGYANKSGVHSSSSVAIGASVRVPISESALQFDYAFQIIMGGLKSNATHRVSTNIVF
ncbi:TPA: PorV/PorQ family protein [Candidatus Poribacteria bacterium]|nr:PorV/PorQ family protein [Candidatus Poribacteria bacterium]